MQAFDSKGRICLTDTNLGGTDTNLGTKDTNLGGTDTNLGTKDTFINFLCPLECPMTKVPTTTLSVIRAATDQPDELIVAGEVAEIRFPNGASLSLLASKLFVALLDLAGADVTEDRTHRATLASLNWGKRELAEIEDAFYELHATTVTLISVTDSYSGSVLAEVRRPKIATQGEIHWRFSRPFQQVVKNSRHWAAISARAVLAMESKYTPWLYQLAALHAGRTRVSEDWDLADLRERLGASAPSLRRWIAFRQRVLDPACAEINQLTGIGIAWEPIKHGRKIMGVRISTWRKGAGELADTAAELERHSTGRKERRHELVERIVAERATWSRETEGKLADLTARRAAEKPAADPRQTGLEEAVAVAGVRLTPAQLMLGAEAARAEGGAQIDVQAVYADWLRAAAQRKDPLRNPAGHWIDFCKRRAREQRDGGN